MSARYMLLDTTGKVIGEIIHPKVLEQINQFSGFAFNGKNYLYAYWLTNGEYQFFQEAGRIGRLLNRSVKLTER